MKKWTVMLIPHDREDSTRTLILSNLHFGSVALVLVAMSFVCAFFYQRNTELLHRADLLRQANRVLELENSKKAELTQSAEPGRDSVRQVEDKLRAEYDASISAITSELEALYEMETKARNITGLAPRTPQPPTVTPLREGKGGSFGGNPAIALAKAKEIMHPPAVIYGMSRPSADLIVQEIRLRTQSLDDLVKDMEAQRDLYVRMPAGWPVAKGAGSLSSTFGYRLDPINHRLSRHDGYDISAPYGTGVITTAKGVVESASWDGAYGNTIIIDHGGGLHTKYCHLSAMDVRQGQSVDRGTVIGHVGSTGRSTGCHLHYEVHVGERPVDPAKYITR